MTIPGGDKMWLVLEEHVGGVGPPGSPEALAAVERVRLELKKPRSKKDEHPLRKESGDADTRVRSEREEDSGGRG